MLSSMRQREAARLALLAHDALVATREKEPPSNADGMPLDATAWLRWRTEVSEPAYAQWDDAMHVLSVALGYEVGRHPYTFRPICKAILRDGAA